MLSRKGCGASAYADDAEAAREYWRGLLGLLAAGEEETEDVPKRRIASPNCWPRARPRLESAGGAGVAELGSIRASGTLAGSEGPDSMEAKLHVDGTEDAADGAGEAATPRGVTPFPT